MNPEPYTGKHRAEPRPDNEIEIDRSTLAEIMRMFRDQLIRRMIEHQGGYPSWIERYANDLIRELDGKYTRAFDSAWYEKEKS